MLTSLSVRDVVLIDRLELPLGPGLTVLTGETGAGKSILLDSLGLALGSRGGAGLVRAGCAQANVAAAFAVAADHPAHAVLADGGIEADADEALVLRRTLAADGRSRAFVNDQPVGTALLRRLGAVLVEIQGQHEQMGLADAAAHRPLLDAFGVPPGELAALRDAHAAWKDVAGRLAAAQAALAAAAREEDWLRAATAELATLAPEPDEEERLASRRVSLQGGERRREAIAAALGELSPRDRRNPGPAAALRAAARALGRAAMPDEDGAARALADEAAAAIDRAEEALGEAETLLSRLAAEAEDDPRALEEAETRLFALRAAARKHNVPATELPSLLAGLRARLEALEGGQRGLEALEGETRAAHAAFAAAAEGVALRRREAAAALERAVAAELAPLKLGRARFVVSVEALPPGSWGENGADTVTFLLAANPGSAPAPLGRVASGGELSRLMLGLKVVLAAGTPAGTLVFDEVDQGIGGATASAVGERLAALARGRQVLVVTHAPQVAARADHHLNVAKRVRGEVTTTSIATLDANARREEIARMLAGERVTDAARAAASDLLL